MHAPRPKFTLPRRRVKRGTAWSYFEWKAIIEHLYGKSAYALSDKEIEGAIRWADGYREGLNARSKT